MYQILFFNKNKGTGDKIYVWGSDLECARLYLEDHGHIVSLIIEDTVIEWLYYAYIKESNKRFKKWWAKG